MAKLIPLVNHDFFRKSDRTSYEPRGGGSVSSETLLTLRDLALKLFNPGVKSLNVKWFSLFSLTNKLNVKRLKYRVK